MRLVPRLVETGVEGVVRSVDVLEIVHQGMAENENKMAQFRK